MIDPDSGSVVLDAATLLQAGMSQQTFLASSIGCSARAGARNADYQWYSADVIVEGEPWLAGLCFNNNRLEIVTLSPRSPYTSWSDFSSDYEERTAIRLCSILRRWLDREPSMKMPLMDTYSLPWGQASAGLAPQNAAASMGVHYRLPPEVRCQRLEESA